MVSTFHRKNKYFSFNTCCYIGIFQNRDINFCDIQTNRQTGKQSDDTNINVIYTYPLEILIFELLCVQHSHDVITHSIECGHVTIIRIYIVIKYPHTFARSTVRLGLRVQQNLNQKGSYKKKYTAKGWIEDYGWP